MVDGDPGWFRFWAEIVEDWMYAPGMMYLGRAGPSKMIELAPLAVSLIEEDGGEDDGGGTNTDGRIGPSKMSTHSLTFSVLGVDEGGGGGTVTVEVMGNICACLEMEDEWVRRAKVEGLRRMARTGMSKVKMKRRDWGWLGI